MRTIGNIGEDIAAAYLSERGYLIIKRNFYTFRGEIDIIAYETKLNEYVFVEVKYRKNLKFGYPSEGIAGKKIKHLTDSINIFFKNIRTQKTSPSYRIDLIEIMEIGDKVDIYHTKNINC